jgi:hypothetical protein
VIDRTSLGRLCLGVLGLGDRSFQNRLSRTARSSRRVTFPTPCSLGDLSTAAGCDIGDRKDLEKKAAHIETVELVVADSLLVEQWYQQLIVSSTH